MLYVHIVLVILQFNFSSINCLRKSLETNGKNIRLVKVFPTHIPNLLLGTSEVAKFFANFCFWSLNGLKKVLYVHMHDTAERTAMITPVNLKLRFYRLGNGKFPD